MAVKKFVEKNGKCLCCNMEVDVRLVRLRRVPRHGEPYEYQWLCRICRIAEFYKGNFNYVKKIPKAHLKKYPESATY